MKAKCKHCSATGKPGKFPFGLMKDKYCDECYQRQWEVRALDEIGIAPDYHKQAERRRRHANN